jgi:cell fate regulator YaaT (PSP1 superfamily)
MSRSTLVRYGTIAEVARFVNASDVAFRRGERVVVRTHRGIEVGTMLEESPPLGDTSRATVDDPQQPADFQILRTATDEDLWTVENLKVECQRQFDIWRRRIADWKLRLELIDLERTLDNSKLILYVLNDRGPECTRLALQAAAAGLGIVEVQPVGPDGVRPPEQASGCGTGGCGSGGNSGGCCH